MGTNESNVRALLGAPLRIDGRGRPTLFGQPLKEAKLSEGQTRLLQLALVLSIPEDQPVIIFWDEPELHLHPGIVIRFPAD